MSVNLEKRVAHLEKQLAELQKQQSARRSQAGPAWLDDLYGKFAGDPIFQQAMNLGRKYRRSLRPRAAKRKSKR